jgi:hypothetical protein
VKLRECEKEELETWGLESLRGKEQTIGATSEPRDFLHNPSKAFERVNLNLKVLVTIKISFLLVLNPCYDCFYYLLFFVNLGSCFVPIFRKISAMKCAWML